MFLTRKQVLDIIEPAIIEKKILRVKYCHKDDLTHPKISLKAPFDLGTSNPAYYERNKNNLYMFCYGHINDKTNMKEPIVHAISAEHIISIEDTGETFKPVELTDINRRNSKGNYDYRKCNWAIAKNRNWY